MVHAHARNGSCARIECEIATSDIRADSQRAGALIKPQALSLERARWRSRARAPAYLHTHAPTRPRTRAGRARTRVHRRGSPPGVLPDVAPEPLHSPADFFFPQPSQDETVGHDLESG